MEAGGAGPLDELQAEGRFTMTAFDLNLFLWFALAWWCFIGILYFATGAMKFERNSDVLFWGAGLLVFTVLRVVVA